MTGAGAAIVKVAGSVAGPTPMAVSGGVTSSTGWPSSLGAGATWLLTGGVVSGGGSTSSMPVNGGGSLGARTWAIRGPIDTAAISSSAHNAVETESETVRNEADVAA